MKKVLWSILIVIIIGGLASGAMFAPDKDDYEDESWWPVWEWFTDHGIAIFAYIIIGFLLYSLMHRIVPGIVRRTMAAKERGRLEQEIEQRISTLTTVLTGTGTLLIIIIALAGILQEIGLDVTAVLGGLAIVGLAVGFGAQHLVKDVIAGFFILLEDQYCVGDWVAISGVDGEVEKLNLRRTCVRDLDGVIHSVPNGAVTVASNYTKDFGRANVVVSVAYKEDLDQVLYVVRQTWDDLTNDPQWSSTITEKDPWILRVDSLGESGIDVRIVARTLPDWQWAVMAELRKRLKRTFDELGIEIPWPHTKVFFGDAPPPTVPSSQPTKRHRPRPPEPGE